MDRCQEIYDRIVARGQAAIEEFIADRKSEDLFLDFKCSSNNGDDKILSNLDRKTIAEAISGFGNSEGGVIVWGVDRSLDKEGADVAPTQVFINNPISFANLLQDVISGCTLPPHSAVKNHVIEIGDNRGFVVTLIPKSNFAPHQMLPNKQYYIRAGSDFVPTPHDVLAGMFGRRPQPQVSHRYHLATPELIGKQLKISFGIAINNEGPGIASDIFCTCHMQNLPGENSQMNFETPDQQNWTGSLEFGSQVSLISVQAYRLPPGANTQPLIIYLSLTPPFEGALKISGTVGSGESRRYEFLIERNAQQIQKLYDLFAQKVTYDSFEENEKNEIAMAIIADNKLS